MEGTGGGPALDEVVSDIEIRLLAVLGENFGGQLEGVAVEPFGAGNQVPVQVEENMELIVLDDQNNLVERPINAPELGPDELREEVIQCASPEGLPVDQLPADQAPADQAPPVAQRATRRGPLRQRRTRQRNRPQTAFDEAHSILANIETKRVEAEQLNATSFAEIVKLLSRKISIDERAAAAQEELGRQMTTAIKSLADSIIVLTERSVSA